MVLLAPDRIKQIIDAAADLGLADPLQRKVLLAGLDPVYVARLEVHPTPLSQLLLDIWAMNRTVQVVGPGLPLADWLRNAAMLIKARAPQQSDFFNQCAEGLRPLPEES